MDARARFIGSLGRQWSPLPDQDTIDVSARTREESTDELKSHASSHE